MFLYGFIKLGFINLESKIKDKHSFFMCSVFSPSVRASSYARTRVSPSILPSAPPQQRAPRMRIRSHTAITAIAATSAFARKNSPLSASSAESTAPTRIAAADAHQLSQKDALYISVNVNARLLTLPANLAAHTHNESTQRRTARTNELRVPDSTRRM